MDERMRQELEAAAFRALRDHLRARTDVQNMVPDRGRARLASAGFGWLESGWKVACHCRDHPPESAIGGEPTRR